MANFKEGAGAKRVARHRASRWAMGLFWRIGWIVSFAGGTGERGVFWGFGLLGWGL